MEAEPPQADIWAEIRGMMNADRENEAIPLVILPVFIMDEAYYKDSTNNSFEVTSVVCIFQYKRSMELTQEGCDIYVRTIFDAKTDIIATGW